MQDFEIIGMLRTYINQTLVGMGALKGAACQILSIVDGTNDHTITFKWEDNDGVSHEDTMVVTDGIDGFSPTITVKTSTDSTYILTITDKNGSFDTPNLKGGGGGGGASSMEDLSDVVITSIQDGQILKWDDATSKWVNASLGDAAWKDSTNAVTEDSTDLLESGAAFTALADKVDKVSGKGLSENDFTDAEKTKLEGIESGAEVNVIDEIQVNGTAVTPSGKAVNIEVVESISVNGVAQTVTSGAVDLDVASNLITETQWTAIGNLFD